MSRVIRSVAEELVDLEVPSEVRISPSGEHVVYSLSPVGQKSEHKISSIWLARIGENDSARRLTMGTYNDRTPQWSPDGELVAFLSDRGNRGKSCAIYVIPLQGAEVYPISKIENERDISTFSWSPDGLSLAFISPDEISVGRKAREKEKDDAIVYGKNWAYNRLRVVDMTTREVENFFSRDIHISTFAWSEDSKQIACVLQDTPEEDSANATGVRFETLSVIEKNENTEITAFPGAIEGPLLWSDNDIYFLGGTEPSKCTSSLEVYKVSLRSKDWIEHPHNDQETCVVGLCHNGPLTTIKVECGLLDEIYVLNEDHHCQNEKILSCRHEISTWDAVQTADNNYILAIVKSSVSCPREVYSYRINGESKCAEDLTQLSGHGRSIRSRRNGSSQDIYCNSLDGTTNLDGLFLSPSVSSPETDSNLGSKSDSTGKPLPTVVLIHGGPYSRIIESFNTPSFFWSPLLLSSKKCGILLPNYRGGSSHGESFTRHARGGMGTVDYDDIIALVDEGIKRGLVDPEHIVVGGWSQGGFLSYLLAVRRNSQGKPGSTWKIKGAICGAGITDWDMMVMTSDLPRFEAELAGASPWAVGQVRGKNDTTARQGSAIWELKGQKLPPILILHGEEDKAVPVSQGVAFRRGCQYYGVPFQMVVYPREGHVIKERAHLVDMLARVSKFTLACLQRES